MQHHFAIPVIIVAFLSSSLQAQQQDATLPFDPLGHSNFVNYWGQNSASESGQDRSAWQKPLSFYCRDDTENILVIAFLYQFGGNSELQIDLSNASDNCTLFGSTQLLNCHHMESDIRYCQSRGRKILLSLGGAAGSYGIRNEAEGEQVAKDLWDMFGGGTSKTRPFGNVSVDGFDLDIEAGSTQGYSALVKRLRELYASDKSKDYYISGAPQCPFPDQYMSDALTNAWFDFVWVQFYNNYCQLTSTEFNYDEWDEWARTQSVNKNVRLFLGVPGSKDAAGSGYVSYDRITQTISALHSKYTSFGGVMMWDASAAYTNTEDGELNYAVAVSRFLHGLEHSKNSAGNNQNATSRTTTNAATVTPTRSATTVSTTPLAPTSTPTASANSTSTKNGSNDAASNMSSTGTQIGSISANAVSTTSATSELTTRATPTSSAVVNGAVCSNNWACVGDKFAQCVYGKWIVRPCPGGLVCHEIGAGTSVYCGYPAA